MFNTVGVLSVTNGHFYVYFSKPKNGMKIKVVGKGHTNGLPLEFFSYDRVIIREFNPGWRDCTAAKKHWLLARGPRFNSQHLHVAPSVNPVPGDQTPSFGLRGRQVCT